MARFKHVYLIDYEKLFKDAVKQLSKVDICPAGKELENCPYINHKQSCQQCWEDYFINKERRNK